MTSMSTELDRLASTFMWRGLAMLVLGFAAIVRPEEALIVAMLGVASLARISTRWF